MEVIILKHARRRMRERKIPEELVRSAISNPDEIAFDKTARNRYIVKKVYRTVKNARYILLVIYERKVEEIKVITVISTSKIDKYL